MNTALNEINNLEARNQRNLNNNATLRKYQIEAVSRLRNAVIRGIKKIILALPTGAGKSLIAGQIISNAVSKGNKVLWIVHRRNLVKQMHDVLKKYFDIDAGIIMAGIESETDKLVQLCTIQSYSRRLNLDALEWNKFYISPEIVIVDECHRSISKSYKSLLKLYKDKIIIGFTATPARADGRGMGELYEEIIDIANIKNLTEQGYLCPIRYFVPSKIDLDGVKIVMGDYQIKELAEKTIKKKLIGDIVDNWLKCAENRKTIVFCVNVKHSIAICEEFNRRGIPAEHLDAHSTDDERDAVFSKMERGDITVICNVALYQEGLDVPSVSCIVMARPTKSMGLYRQCVGRGLRIENGKENCILMDHGNVIEEHGLLEWPVTWTLDGKRKAWSKPRRETVKKLVKCIACGLVFEGRNVCPDCGTQVKAFGQAIETIDAELEELDAKKEKGTVTEKRLYLGMLRWWVPRQRNPNPKRVLAIFRERYGVWPGNSYKDVAPIPPDQAFLNRMKHQQIKYIKRKEKEGAANVS